MRTGPRRKGKDKAAKEPKKSGKKMTKWDDTRVSKKEAEALDRSKTVRLAVANEWWKPSGLTNCILMWCAPWLDHRRGGRGAAPREA